MEQPPEVAIKRDLPSHRWAIVLGSHLKLTPWEDTADAVSVIMWIKTNANGAVNLRVE